MSDAVFIIVPLSIFIVGVVFFTLLALRGKRSPEEKRRKKGSEAVIRDAKRRLAQNPRNLEALKDLADAQYEAERYDEAAEGFKSLLETYVPDTSPFDEYELTIKYALASMECKKYAEAYKSFILARNLQKDTFEVNYNLGYLEYLRKNYDRALSLLREAFAIRPDDTRTEMYLAYAMLKTGKAVEALDHLNHVVDVMPQNREAQFTLAQCYHVLKRNDQAVRIFSHLRPHPKFGPSASLYAGTIHIQNRHFEEAIEDLEIGLKHKDMKEEVRTEMMYRLSAAYVKSQDLSKAVHYLEKLVASDPDYKDAAKQLDRYRELNINQNLQVFLIGSTSEFVTICRKLTVALHPGLKVKVVDISVHKNENADIIAEVYGPRGEETVLCRYIRTSGDVGELFLRDMYARIKDVHAVRGYCIAAGRFSEGARQFTDARLIDLIDKDQLTKMLRKLDRSAPSPG